MEVCPGVLPSRYPLLIDQPVPLNKELQNQIFWGLLQSWSKFCLASITGGDLETLQESQWWRVVYISKFFWLKRCPWRLGCWGFFSVTCQVFFRLLPTLNSKRGDFRVPMPGPFCRYEEGIFITQVKMLLCKCPLIVPRSLKLLSLLFLC